MANNEINEKIKKNIIISCIKLIENSDLFKERFGINYTKIEVNGKILFIRFNETIYNSLLAQIFKDLNLKHNFTSEYVNEFIVELTIEILKNGITIVKSDPLIVDNFNYYFYESTVYIPLDGIKMIKPLLTVGKINLREFTQSDADFHLENLSNIMEINPHYNPKEVEKILKSDEKRFYNLVGLTCAEYKVFAEPKIAIELAEDECERVLDLIRWAISYLHHKDHRTYIGMQGEVARSSRNTIVAKLDFDSYYFRSQLIGAKRKLEINDRIISELRSIEFFKMSNILKKSYNKIGDFERSLLIGIQWFSYSQMQSNPENEFLSLIICIETFLTPNHDVKISSFISQAIAIILADDEHKESLMNDIKGYYDIRSKIVHKGKANLNKDDVDNLRHIVKFLIIWMIKNKNHISSQDYLVNLIRNKQIEQTLTLKLDFS